MTEKPPPSKQPTRSEAETNKTSGRISFDKRGNPVWEWALKTGIFGDIDTKRLRALEAKDLKILDEPKKEKDPAKPGEQTAKPLPTFNPLRDKGGGMNPYDNTSASPSHHEVLAQLTNPGKPAVIHKPEPRRLWWKKLFGRP